MNQSKAAPNDKPSGRTPKRRRLLIVMTVVGGVLCSFLLLECGLRVYVAARGWTPNCYAAHLSLFRPHPQLGADLAPDFRLKTAVFTMTTNSRGLRGPEITAEPADATIRIAVLGGSTVFGYQVSDGHSAARKLEEMLRDRGVKAEVINGGVPGYNLFQTNARFRDVIAPLEPDLVVLYAGFNDIPYLTSTNPSAEKWRRRSVAPAWERCLGKSVTYGFVRYRLLGIPADLSIPEKHESVTDSGREQFRQNLETLAEQVDRAAAGLVICRQVTAYHPSLTDDLRQRLDLDDAELDRAIHVFDVIRNELSDFAASRNLPLLDPTTEIAPDSENLADTIHLTETGEERLARFWTNRLLPLVKPTELPKQQ